MRTKIIGAATIAALALSLGACKKKEEAPATTEALPTETAGPVEATTPAATPTVPTGTSACVENVAVAAKATVDKTGDYGTNGWCGYRVTLPKGAAITVTAENGTVTLVDGASFAAGQAFTTTAAGVHEFRVAPLAGATTKAYKVKFVRS